MKRSDRCIENLNMFECHSAFVWVVKVVIPVIASVGAYFLCDAVQLARREEGSWREVRFWISVVFAEVLHFYKSFLPFERETVAVVYLSELAMTLVFLVSSAQMIGFMQKSFGRISTWAGVGVIVLKCVVLLMIAIVLVSFWAHPEPSVYSRELAKAVHTIELAGRVVFVWATCVGFVNERRFDWNFKLKVRNAMRFVMFLFMVLSVAWTAIAFSLDMFHPNMLRIWMLLGSGRRTVYLVINGVLELVTGDLCVILAGVCLKAVLWAEHRETDRVVNNQAAMNSIMTNIVLE